MYFLPTDEFECFESWTDINQGVALHKSARVIFAINKYL